MRILTRRLPTHRAHLCKLRSWHSSCRPFPEFAKQGQQRRQRQIPLFQPVCFSFRAGHFPHKTAKPIAKAIFHNCFPDTCLGRDRLRAPPVRLHRQFVQCEQNFQTRRLRNRLKRQKHFVRRPLSVQRALSEKNTLPPRRTDENFRSAIQEFPHARGAASSDSAVSPFVSPSDSRNNSARTAA